jgi:hypothetical protein
LTRKLPSSVPYAALLTYAPKGTSDASKKAKDAAYAIKQNRNGVVRMAVERLAETLRNSYVMRAFFGNDVTLVPMPRSSLLVAGALWPADVICQEMVRQGLAAGVEHALRRTTAVPKSAFATKGQRPDLDKHLATMAATPWLASGKHITVVDDVVTKGRTLFAGCVLVQEVQPGATVRAFGLVRTQGFAANVAGTVDPVVGELRQSGGDVDRHP